MRGKRRLANRRASSTFTNNGRLDPNIARPSRNGPDPYSSSFRRRVGLRLGCLALGTGDDDRVEVGDLAEPNEDAVAPWERRITDVSVVVFGLPLVELQHEHPLRQQAF